jgi:hypothetical protein
VAKHRSASSNSGAHWGFSATDRLHSLSQFWSMHPACAIRSQICPQVGVPGARTPDDPPAGLPGALDPGLLDPIPKTSPEEPPAVPLLLPVVPGVSTLPPQAPARSQAVTHAQKPKVFIIIGYSFFANSLDPAPLALDREPPVWFALACL